ncbi:MAG: LacI family transcriptional regulator [Treponema sp.]|jgi:LacI family transcriptional regulator|nr:LacI family transcriptional regulator [Treponema sp.]
MVNIVEIAQLVGVSPSTVSRVINGKPYVKAEKKKEILKIVEETGYIPNKAARNMVLRRSFTVGIVIPDDFNMFRRQLFSIIERHLNAFGYHTLFFFVKQDEESEKTCLDRLKSENLDGIIMLHEMKSPGFYRYLESARIPAVSTTCGSGAVPAVPTVTLDDESAAVDAVNHLIGLGHRNIAMLNGKGFSYGNRRLDGYLKALEAAGGRDCALVIEADRYSSQAGLEAMGALLDSGAGFTAVFASSDELAIGAMRALRDRGLKVPGDVSVMGFDDIDISNYLCPRLSTIRQPIAEIGEQAALMLHRFIRGEKEDGAGAVLPHTLVARESTKGTGPRVLLNPVPRGP